MRLFIALLLPAAVQEALTQAAQALRSLTPRARFTRPENYHLTLFFLGEVEEEQLSSLQQGLEQVAAANSGFRLQLGATGSFPSRQGRTIWVGLQNPPAALEQVQRTLTQTLARLGWSAGNRFSPHITLARQAAVDGEEKACRCPPLTWEVHHIALMESCRIDGQLTYIPLARFPLAGE